MTRARNQRSLKTGERSEEQRRLAILCTELEKVAAFANYILTRNAEEE